MHLHYNNAEDYSSALTTLWKQYIYDNVISLSSFIDHLVSHSSVTMSSPKTAIVTGMIKMQRRLLSSYFSSLCSSLGATKGIGRQIATQLAAAGYKVCTLTYFERGNASVGKLIDTTRRWSPAGAIQRS